MSIALKGNQRQLDSTTQPKNNRKLTETMLSAEKSFTRNTFSSANVPYMNIPD
jgi:hypothetical protein